MMRTFRLNALAQCSRPLGTRGLASSKRRMEEGSFVSSCLLGSSSRLAPESPFALRRGLRLMQPMTCAFGDRIGVGGLASPHPILGASGARDSAGAVLGHGCPCRVVLRHVPMVLETVQAQFTAPVAEPTVVSFTVPLFLYYRCHCNWCDLVLFVGRLLWLSGPCAARVFASRCRVVVVLLLVVLTILFGTV